MRSENFHARGKELTVFLNSAALAQMVVDVFVFVFGRTEPFAYSRSVGHVELLEMSRFLRLDGSGLTSCWSSLLGPLRGLPVSRFATPAAISIGNDMQDKPAFYK